MTRIMQLSDIAVTGVRLPGVDMVNGCEVTRRIDNHLRDYCCNGMGNSSSDRCVTKLGWTTNGYIRVEYKVMDSTRVAASAWAIFFLRDGSFYRGPEMGYIDDLHPIGPQPPPPPPSKPPKPWYLTTGKADFDYENQP